MTPRQIIETQEWQDHYNDPANQYYRINAQQLAKNPILLDCLASPEGMSFVQLDYTALEPNVLAEFSKCPTYREIYSSGKPHDVYFYVSCKLLDKDGSMAAVYQPDNPTKETVAAAKKQFKPQRSVGKVFQLMSTYKAGAAAIFRKLILLGVDTTKQEVEENRKTYWGPDLFEAVLDYEEDLLAEVDQRDGWMLNGLGRPFVVTDRKRKDVVNTHTQSTGHDCTDLLILEAEKMFNEFKVPAVPVVPDYHDETIWMVPNDHAKRAGEYLAAAVTGVNHKINFSIPLKGDPEITKDFTSFKQPDPIEWYTEKCNAG